MTASLKSGHLPDPNGQLMSGPAVSAPVEFRPVDIEPREIEWYRFRLCPKGRIWSEQSIALLFSRYARKRTAPVYGPQKPRPSRRRRRGGVAFTVKGASD